jgi:hypothetical protein
MSATSAVLPTTTNDPAGSDALVINRAAEAQRVVAFLTTTTRRFVVLCGQASSGKTTLLKRWLIPALRDATEKIGYQVYYGACAPSLPDVVQADEGESPIRLDDAMSRRSIVLIDEFDRLLDLGRDERRAELDRVFARFERAHADAIVAVMVSERELTSVYALASYDPDIVNAVFELHAIGLAEGLEQLSAGHPETSATYSAEVLQALRDDATMLERRGSKVTFDLLSLLHDRFARERRNAGKNGTGPAQYVIEKAQYARIGGVAGILRDHLEAHLEALASLRTNADGIARAILHAVVAAQSRGAPTDMGEIAARFEATADDMDAILGALTAPEGLLEALPNGMYQCRPPQLVAVIADDAASRQLRNERLLRMIDDGLRGWRLLGTFLPAPRFTEIHRQRRHLILDAEQIRFLLQCALRADGELSDAAGYWFRRMASRDDAMDILLAAVLDPATLVRARAATLLGVFPEPLVRDRLCVLALSDAEREVRENAVASLAHMADDDLRERLLREVRNVNSAYRTAAIEALRVFRTTEVVAELQTLVSGADTALAIRQTAVAVLASLSTAESINALVDIALNDEDKEDRDAAAKALATTASEGLNKQILMLLGWRRPLRRVISVGALLAVGVLLGSGVILMIMELLDWPSVGVGTVGLTLLAIVLSTGLLLRRVSDGRLKPRSPAGVIAFLLLGFCSMTVLPWIHGGAHMMVKRWRRGVALLALEIIGIALYYVVAGAMAFVQQLWIVAWLYRFAGVVLFFGTWFYDVLAVTTGTFVLRRTLTREARRTTIYRELLGNPAMVDAIFADLKSDDPAEVRRVRALLRRFGSRIRPQKLVQMFAAGDAVYRPYVMRALRKAKTSEAVAALEAMWPTASREERGAITTLLSRNPTPASLDALERVGSATGTFTVVRAPIARLQFRVAVWPWAARIAVLCVVPAIAVLLYHGVMIERNHHWAEIIMLRQRLPQADKIEIVKFLARVDAEHSAPELRALFAEGHRSGATPDLLHAAIASGLVSIHTRQATNDAFWLRRAATDSLTGEKAVHDSIWHQLKPDLVAELEQYDNFLVEPDTTYFVAGLDLLQAVTADSMDTDFAEKGLERLTNFVVQSETDAIPDSLRRKQRAIRAIAILPYERALPSLDRVLSQRLKSKRSGALTSQITDLLQTRMLRIAAEAQASISLRDTLGRSASPWRRSASWIIRCRSRSRR